MSFMDRAWLSCWTWLERNFSEMHCVQDMIRIFGMIKGVEEIVQMAGVMFELANWVIALAALLGLGNLEFDDVSNS